MTYAGLAVPFLTVAVTLLVVGAAVQRPDATWWRATGLTVGLAPVEDLAWPVAAALGLPGLWLLLEGGER